ncbi:MAG: GWxTD domain-containing protein [Thermoanaerobaculia bacterium]|nr:GWxTD domain-containing protein [Thermoanaerobaculia bacterium]
MSRGQALALGLTAFLAAPLTAQRERDRVELLQPFLGASYSQWLVGAVGRMATPEEIDGFMALRADAEAEAFVAEFWRRRDPDPDAAGNPTKELFDQRVAEADRRFSEAAYSGSRTDRGTILILYGEPERISFEEQRDVSEPDVELWQYPKKAEEGLDGRRPQRKYRFARRGDLTTFYRPRDPADPRRRVGREPTYRSPRSDPFPPPDRN